MSGGPGVITTTHSSHRVHTEGAYFCMSITEHLDAVSCHCGKSCLLLLVLASGGALNVNLIHFFGKYPEDSKAWIVS